jgi:hypothetical protein
VPKAGPPKYDDLATDEGFLYRLQGDDPGAYDNVSLLRSADERLPLIYFYGIAPASTVRSGLSSSSVRRTR